MKTKNTITTILFIFVLLLSGNINAQSFNADKTALTNFLVRMYKHATFDIKVVEDYDNHYLVSVVILDPHESNIIAS